MPVGPLAGWRLAELGVQAGGPAGSNGRLHQNRAHGVCRSGRPRNPVTRECLRPAFKVAYRHHLFARGCVHDANVIEKHIAWSLAESKVQGAGSRRIVLGDELKFDGTASRLDPDGRGSWSAEEHSRTHRPAIYHQARRTGRGLDANREAPGGPGFREDG